MASLRNLGAHLGWTAPDDLRHTPNAAPCRLSGSREELRELGLLPEIGAVVLTINGGGGGSYDQLFSQVQQKGPDGTAVAVYEANYEALGLVAAALADPEQADALASNSDLDARVAGLVAGGLPSGFAQTALTSMFPALPARFFRWREPPVPSAGRDLSGSSFCPLRFSGGARRRP